MLTPYRVVIVHGAYGNPEENWFPWLKQQLENDGRKVFVPTFPTPQGQDPKAWMQILDTEVQNFGKDLVMVGHSLGPALILRKLEIVKEPIRAAFLISPFVGNLGLPDFDSINAPFFVPPFNWTKIKSNCPEFYTYSGDNDPYVPLSKGEEVAKNLGAMMQVIKGGGHINASAGYTRFDKLLADIRALRKT